MIETIVICTVFGAFIMTAFIVGLHYGSKVKKEEYISLPNLNPIKAAKEHKETKKIEKQVKETLEIEAINLANIDAYDGTGTGQKDFPE